MSATPRTDAEASDGWSGDAVCVSGDFARQLERDLTAALARAEQAEAELAKWQNSASKLAIGDVSGLTDAEVAVAALACRLKQSEAANAQLREALTNASAAVDDLRRADYESYCNGPSSLEEIDAALSTDAGKGWLSPQEAEKLRKEMDELLEISEDLQFALQKCSHWFGKQGRSSGMSEAEFSLVNTALNKSLAHFTKHKPKEQQP